MVMIRVYVTIVIKFVNQRFNTDIMLMVGDDDKMYDKKLQRYAEDNRAAL